jgi:hypothetical protein
MKTYLTLKSIPELTDLPGEERLRLWRKHALKAFRHRKTWIGFVIYATIMIAGCIVSLQMHPWIPFGYVVAGSICGASFWIFLQFWVSAVRMYLKEERNNNGSNKIC